MLSKILTYSISLYYKQPVLELALSLPPNPFFYLLANLGNTFIVTNKTFDSNKPLFNRSL